MSLCQVINSELIWDFLDSGGNQASRAPDLFLFLNGIDSSSDVGVVFGSLAFSDMFSFPSQAVILAWNSKP